MSARKGTIELASREACNRAWRVTAERADHYLTGTGIADYAVLGPGFESLSFSIAQFDNASLGISLSGKNKAHSLDVSFGNQAVPVAARVAVAIHPLTD